MEKIVARIVGFMLLLGFFCVYAESCAHWLVVKTNNIIIDVLNVFNVDNKNTTKDKAEEGSFDETIEYINIVNNINVSVTNVNNTIKLTNININNIREEIQLIENNINMYSEIKDISIVDNYASDNKELTKIKQKLEKMLSQCNALEEERKKTIKELSKLKAEISKFKDEEFSKFNDLREKENRKYNEKYEDLRKKYDKLLESYEIPIKENISEIEKLEKRVEGLTQRIEMLKDEIEDLKDKDKGQKPSLENNQVQCFYAVGTAEKLIESGIINKNILGKLVINKKEYNNVFYIPSTTKELKEIHLYSREAEILSDMPSDSYQFREINSNKIIVITNPEKFWSKTKYLVVVTTNGNE